MIKIFVLKRPGLEEFLKKASELYELVIYTASMSKYANPLLDKIDPRVTISYRLFREHCTFVGGGFVKDLSRLGRDLKNVIFIDNSPTSYAFQPFNAIPIKTWIDDKKDTQLYDFLPILELLAKADDVREYLKRLVKNDEINCAEALKVLRAELDRPKIAQVETKKTLLNNWIPQQGKIISQTVERTQQSQVAAKEFQSQQQQHSTSRYTKEIEESANNTTINNTHLASSYYPVREAWLKSSVATTKHEYMKYVNEFKKIEERANLAAGNNLNVTSTTITLLSETSKATKRSTEPAKDERKASPAKSARVSATPTKDTKPQSPSRTFLVEPEVAKYSYQSSLQRDKYESSLSRSTPRKTPTVARHDLESTPTADNKRTSAIRAEHRNISEEKGVNPSRTSSATYYNTAIRTKLDLKETETKQQNEPASSKHRLAHSSSTTNNKQSAGASDTIASYLSSKERTATRYEPESAKHSSNIVANLLSSRRSAQLNSAQTEYQRPSKTQPISVLASKSVSSGFYSYTPERRVSSSTNTEYSTPQKRPSSAAKASLATTTVMHETSQYQNYYYQYQKEKERIREREREREREKESFDTTINRTNMVVTTKANSAFPTYLSSAARTAWIAQYYNA